MDFATLFISTSMKKEKTSKAQANDEMRREYDFPGGMRGKHYQAYRRGHTVTIHKTDGSTVVRHFKLEDGAVMLEPDVRAYFPDSEAVNSALRCLIPLLPQNPKPKRESDFRAMRFEIGRVIFSAWAWSTPK